MGKMFLSPSTSKDSTDDLVDIFPCRFGEVTLPMLGAAFFERGWLALSWLDIHPSDTVALGDVGYVTEDGRFVAVDNVHRSLQANSGTLSWEGNQMFYNSGKFPDDTSADIIVSESRKSYQRRRHVHFQVSFDLINQITLDFPLSLSPHVCTWILTYTMKISMRCMRGGCCSTTRTRSSRSMASVFPRTSWCLVSGCTRPRIVSDPQHVQLFTSIAGGQLI